MATNWGVLLLISDCPWIVSHCLPLRSVASFPYWRKNPGELLWQPDPSSARGCRGWFAPITSPKSQKKHGRFRVPKAPGPQVGFLKSNMAHGKGTQDFGFNLIGNTSRFGKPFETTFQCVCFQRLVYWAYCFLEMVQYRGKNGIFCTLTGQMLATSEIDWICHSSGHFALTGYASWISKLLPFEVSSLNTWFLACVLYIGYR